MKVGVLGARGRVGSEICIAVEAAEGLELVARIDAGDDIAALVGGQADRAHGASTGSGLMEA